MDRQTDTTKTLPLLAVGKYVWTQSEHLYANQYFGF